MIHVHRTNSKFYLNPVLVLMNVASDIICVVVLHIDRSPHSSIPVV